MEKNINITLSEQELRDICAALTMWVGRKNAPSNWKHRAERLTAMKKKYSEQKNYDAACLAASGGKTDLLSGESGRLRRAIRGMEEHHVFVEERCKRMLELRDQLREYLPPKEDNNEQAEA